MSKEQNTKTLKPHHKAVEDYKAHLESKGASYRMVPVLSAPLPSGDERFAVIQMTDSEKQQIDDDLTHAIRVSMGFSKKEDAQ